MIECVCVDDSKKPSKIADNKWLKKGETYHIIYATYVMPQRKIAVQLKEVNLDDSCAPYEFFLAERFAFKDEDLNKLMYLIMDCSVANVSIKELLDETINEGAADTD